MTKDKAGSQNDVFTKIQLVKAMDFFCRSLSQEAERINALNVFPVPDGDTGTNMAATARETFAALLELFSSRRIEDITDSLVEEIPMEELCKSISRGSLMGARGNSGVILCQILRAFCDTLSKAQSVDAATLAAGIKKSSVAAWESVQKPVKGTMLSVAEGAAMAAEEICTSSCQVGPGEVLEAAAEGSLEALFQTTWQLEVLRQAGLVDSGGAGLTLFYKSLLAAYKGSDLPGLILPEASLLKIEAQGTADGAFFGSNLEKGTPSVASDPKGPFEMSEVSPDLALLQFEVMYLLETSDDAIRPFRSALEAIGDSIVVVGGDGLYNCHVHTDDVGAAIEAALDIGKPRNIRVTYLLAENGSDETSFGAPRQEPLGQTQGKIREETWVREALSKHDTDSSLILDEKDVTIVDAEEISYGKTVIVAVAMGEGISRIFLSLGVGKIISGFQTMNPSTKDILTAVSAFGESDVIILPNNSNIISVAEQAAQLANDNATTSRVYVLPTKGIQEALAALVDFDPMASGEENLVRMKEASESVKAGEITVAIRDSSFDQGAIAKGDYIGIARGQGIVVAEKELSAAVIGLTEFLLENTSELVTLIEGLDYDESSSRGLKDWLEENRPEVTLERLKGGQPIYSYLISVE